MAEVPFELDFALSRRQRIALLRHDWGALFVPFALFAIAVFIFFCVQTAVSVWSLSWPGIAVFGGLALGMLVLHRALLGGLVDVLLVPVRRVNLRVEDNGLGFFIGRERWWLFLDGITSIEQQVAGIWTLRHWNGWVIHIPAGAISDSQLAYLRSQMDNGRTPEGVRAVIERGRRLAELERRR
jgi:hypothetical protein